MRTLNIAMIGFGNAGRAFGKILLKKHQQAQSLGHPGDNLQKARAQQKTEEFATLNTTK